MTVLEMHHEIDPREEIISRVGDISPIKVMHNEILVGVYIRPDAIKIKGGHKLFISDTARDEDRFQGKVGLVLAKGPLAFVDDADVEFKGQNVNIHDWIVCHSGDGWSLTIHGQLCRMVKDNAVRMIVPTPDFVY